MVLNHAGSRVALKVKGGPDIMAKLTIDLPDFDSPKGVTLETLERYAEERGTTVEEFVNIVIADTLGYRDEPTQTAFAGLAALRDQIEKESKT